jgi:hypothetical protein
MRHLDYSNVGVPLSKVSFSCKIRNKDNSTSQICADSSKVMSDLCGPRCVCDMIRAASHQVDHNAGLGFRHGSGTDLYWVAGNGMDMGKATALIELQWFVLLCFLSRTVILLKAVLFLFVFKEIHLPARVQVAQTSCCSLARSRVIRLGSTSPPCCKVWVNHGPQDGWVDSQSLSTQLGRLDPIPWPGYSTPTRHDTWSYKDIKSW